MNEELLETLFRYKIDLKAQLEVLEEERHATLPEDEAEKLTALNELNLTLTEQQLNMVNNIIHLYLSSFK